MLCCIVFQLLYYFFSILLFWVKNMTVNQRVSGSSPDSGAYNSKGFQEIEALYCFYSSDTFPLQITF